MKNNVNKVSSLYCCGCRACEQLCPTKSITIKEDKEGFLAPVVNEECCSDCGLCLERCAQVNDIHIKQSVAYPKVYAAKINDKKLLKYSSSGGIFTIIANFVLEQNGLVFGCSWSKDFVAHHIMIDSKDKLNLLQGSKYVQSDTENTYSQVKQCLKSNKLVLYTGTPCQIGGLKVFLNKDYDNLITTDIVCHGVPSPMLFKKYIDWLGDKYGSKIISYDFRNKERGGWGLMFKAKTRTKTKFLPAYLDPYYKAFLEGKTYRECCYLCKYTSSNRIGDITIGDYWGIEKISPKFYSLEGVSLVLVNSYLGEKVFYKINNQYEVLHTTLNEAKKENKNLYAPVVRPAIRSNIYKTLFTEKFETYIHKYLPVQYSLKSKLKSIIPYRIKALIKKVQY